ncbi:MAG: lytic transglycosylase domain-containing protein, partial [Janthinobacterium lividum]
MLREAWRTLRNLAGFLLGALLLAGSAARAEPAKSTADLSGWTIEQSAQCKTAIAAAESGRATLPGLLLAIAKAESGRPIPPLPGLQPWPWAVNANGAAYYFDSKNAAVAWVTQAVARGVSQIDVGCMQINLQSHPDAFASIEQAFDPAANADYAARFMNRLHTDAGGNWFDAVGSYHSRTPALAADYRARVSAIAQGKTPPVGLGVPLYMRAMQQGTLRIPLAGGGVMRINVHRQPSVRSAKRMTACQIANVLGDFMPARARQRCFATR